jgi:hypothetical protein
MHDSKNIQPHTVRTRGGETTLLQKTKHIHYRIAATFRHNWSLHIKNNWEMFTFASSHHLSCTDKVKKACSHNTTPSQTDGWITCIPYFLARTEDTRCIEENTPKCNTITEHRERVSIKVSGQCDNDWAFGYWSDSPQMCSSKSSWLFTPFELYNVHSNTWYKGWAFDCINELFIITVCLSSQNFH